MISGVRPKQVHRFSMIHVGSAVFIVLWLNVGVGSSIANSVSPLIKIGVLGLWACLAAGRSSDWVRRTLANSWPTLLMIAIALLYAGSIQQSGQYVQGFSYLWIVVALICFYSQAQFRSERNFLVGILSADLAVTAIRTVVALQTDPDLSRYLATTEENRVEIYGDKDFTGLGGYGFAYSMAAVALILLYFAMRGPINRRALLAGTAVASVVVVFEMAYATAIVLTVGLGAIYLVNDLFTKACRPFVYIAISLGWIFGLYSAALASLSEVGWVSPALSVRFQELSDFLSAGSSTGTDLSTRIAFWTQSVDAFLTSSPIGLAGVQAGPASSAGGHSHWFDLLANYGLLTGLVVVQFFLAARISVTVTHGDWTVLRRPWVYFILLGFVNTLLFSSIVLVWVFFIPSLIAYLSSASTTTDAAPMEVAK